MLFINGRLIQKGIKSPSFQEFWLWISPHLQSISKEKALYKQALFPRPTVYNLLWLRTVGKIMRCFFRQSPPRLIVMRKASQLRCGHHFLCSKFLVIIKLVTRRAIRRKKDAVWRRKLVAFDDPFSETVDGGMTCDATLCWTALPTDSS